MHSMRNTVGGFSCFRSIYSFEIEPIIWTKGTWFASQVTLGGRLHSTTTLTDSEKQNVVDTKKTLRVAASVSFGSPWVSASASYAQTDNSAQNTDRNSMVKNMTLTWDAHGGDTLLCSK